MTFNLGAVGSSPTGLTLQIKGFRDTTHAAPRCVPRPSPEITSGRGRSPRRTSIPRSARGRVPETKKRAPGAPARRPTPGSCAVGPSPPQVEHGERRVAADAARRPHCLQLRAVARARPRGRGAFIVAWTRPQRPHPDGDPSHWPYISGEILAPGIPSFLSRIKRVRDRASRRVRK